MIASAPKFCMLLGTLLSTSAWPQSPATVVEGELAVEIDAYLSALEGHDFHGLALLADADRVLLRKAYGSADPSGPAASEHPVRTDSVFTVGSITKQFTAAAIMKLVMQGRVRTDDPIHEYFEDVPEDKRAITLHHLLTHTAGLRSDFAETDFELVDREEYARRALHSQLASKPGERYRYSNSGFSLLAAVVEKVSGLTYEEFLRKELFEPAGMSETGYLAPQWAADRLLQGSLEGESWGTVIERCKQAGGVQWVLLGNGGLHSTLDDMLAWHRALSGDDLFSPEIRRQMFTPHVPEGGGTHYGYGWSIEQTPRGKLITHNGGNGIFATDYLRFADDELMFVISSNRSEASSIAASRVVRRILYGQEYQMPPAIVALEEAEYEGCVGQFATSSGAPVLVQRAGAALQLTPTDAEGFALVFAPSPAVAARAASATERSARIVEASLLGEYEAVQAAFGGQMDIEEVARMEAEMWASLETQLGGLIDLLPLGADYGRFGPRVVIALQCEQGTRYLRYSWEGDELVGIALLDEMPGRRFLPESKESFVDYDIRRQTETRVHFDWEADGERAVALVFEGPETGKQGGAEEGRLPRSGEGVEGR